MGARQTLLRYKIHHLLIWGAVALVWYYLRYQDYRTTNTAWMVTFVKTIDLALMVYICNYVLIPRLLYKKKYLLFVIAFIVLVVAGLTSQSYIFATLFALPALRLIYSTLRFIRRNTL